MWLWRLLINLTEAATGGVLYMKMFLKISQNSQKTPVSKTFEKLRNFLEDLQTSASESNLTDEI